MTYKLKYSILIAIILLTGFHNFIVESAEENTKKTEEFAPEIAATDTQISLGDVPVLEKAFIDSSPVDRKDAIPVGVLGTDGGDKDMIVKLAMEIADNKHGVFDSLLIAHNGKLIFESYYKRGRINMPHPQASATKSYTGLVLGRAIQLGHLSMSDLHKPVVSFLNDLEPKKFIEGAEKITLHQALTMTTGIRINDKNKEKMQKNTERLKGQGEVQTLFELSDPITAESQQFTYSTGPELVIQVIDAVVPGSAKDFIKNEFLGKMGITTFDWRTAESGLPESGWRTSFTSRDMVKIGTLVMNKGQWQGEQLIPKAFITRAISRINHSADDAKVFGGGKDVSSQGYGYFWWNADLKYGNKSYFSASAQGGGPQYIILIEELDLMIVVTAHNNNDNDFLQTTAERILPAFIQ